MLSRRHRESTCTLSTRAEESSSTHTRPAHTNLRSRHRHAAEPCGHTAMHSLVDGDVFQQVHQLPRQPEAAECRSHCDGRDVAMPELAPSLHLAEDCTVRLARCASSQLRCRRTQAADTHRIGVHPTMIPNDCSCSTCNPAAISTHCSPSFGLQGRWHADSTLAIVQGTEGRTACGTAGARTGSWCWKKRGAPQTSRREERCTHPST